MQVGAKFSNTVLILPNNLCSSSFCPSTQVICIINQNGGPSGSPYVLEQYPMPNGHWRKFCTNKTQIILIFIQFFPQQTGTPGMASLSLEVCIVKSFLHTNFTLVYLWYRRNMVVCFSVFLARSFWLLSWGVLEKVWYLLELCLIIQL